MADMLLQLDSRVPLLFSLLLQMPSTTKHTSDEQQLNEMNFGGQTYIKAMDMMRSRLVAPCDHPHFVAGWPAWK